MKKLLSMLLICTIFLSYWTVGAVEYGKEYQNKPAKEYTQKFYDVGKSHWAFSYIGEMHERGVINGYPNGNFYPEKSVQRAEFAKIMVGAAGIKVENTYKTSFDDVSIYDWYAPYIESAKEYLTGYTGTYYNYYLPESNALREDIAVAIVKLKGYDVSTADLSMLDMFTDVESISKNLQKYIAVAVERGLVSGYDDDTFRGQDTITRAEATAMLWRAFQYGNDNKTSASDIVEKDEIDTDKVVNTDTNEDKKETSNTTVSENANKDEDKVEVEDEVNEEEKLPYVIDKLSSAQLDGTIWHKMTMDDKYIYYLDSDNCIYKLDPSTKNKSKLLDTNKLSLEKVEEQEIEVTEKVTETVETGEYEEVVEEVEETVVNEETGEETTVITEVIKQVPITEEVTKEVTTTKTEEVTFAEYNDYVPIQVFYDDVNDRILLSGYYKSIEEAFKSPITDGHYGVVYDITNGNTQALYEGNIEKRGGGRNAIFIATLNDSVYRIIAWKPGGGNDEYDFNIQAGYLSFVKSGYNLLALKHKGELYSIWDLNEVYKYNFSSNDYENFGNFEFNKYSAKDDCLYFCKGDGTMYKASVKTGVTKALDIDFNKNVEFADLGGIKNIYERFFVIDDDTFVFYDTTMGAFRKLEKNN